MLTKPYYKAAMLTYASTAMRLGDLTKRPQEGLVEAARISIFHRYFFSFLGNK